jgi:hypothetical protein
VNYALKRFVTRKLSDALPRRHCDAHPAHVFGCLASGHPEATHERVCHVGSEKIPNRRAIGDLSVQHPINLLARESFRDEEVNQSSDPDLPAGPFHDCDHLAAREADPAQEPGTR